MSVYSECFRHFEFKVGGALPPESFLFLVVTQALALPNATSHCCRSCEVAALKYICCSPGITRSIRVLSTGLTEKKFIFHQVQQQINNTAPST